MFARDRTRATSDRSALRASAGRAPPHARFCVGPRGGRFWVGDGYCRVSVTLPRLCEWYGADLGSSKAEVVRFVLKFLSTDQANGLQQLIRGKSFKVKYHDFSWTFRPHPFAMTP